MVSHMVSASSLIDQQKRGSGVPIAQTISSLGRAIHYQALIIKQNVRELNTVLPHIKENGMTYAIKQKFHVNEIATLSRLSSTNYNWVLQKTSSHMRNARMTKHIATNPARIQPLHPLLTAFALPAWPSIYTTSRLSDRSPILV